MESRKLKRYDSAPISTSASNASAAAAKTGAPLSNIPRPQPGLPPSSSSSSHASKPAINAAAAATPPPTTATTTTAAAATPPGVINPSDPYEKQLEAYCRCLEEDNQALVRYYETHSMDIASLKVLAQEKKFKDAVFVAMEAKTAAMDKFLREVMDVAAPQQQRGLRARGNANTAAAGVGLKGGKAAASSPAPAPAAEPTMENVRDAVQKLQAAFVSVSASEERHQRTIRALEKEVAEWKEKARTSSSSGGAGDGSGAARPAGDEHDACCFFAGTAKDLREAQRKARELDRRLTAATAEAKDAATALAQAEQQHQLTLQTLQRRDDELAAMRLLLSSKDQLLAALEEEAQSVRATTSVSSTPSKSPRTGSSRYSRTNSAPAGNRGHTQHRCGGETSSDRLVVTHHYRLLGGQRFVAGQEFSAEAFKDAFMRSVSTMLHVPYGYLTSVEVRTHSEAVSVELDIRHSARLKEDEIDFLLLSHSYTELMTYLEKVETELAGKTPRDRTAAKVAELQASLTEKDHECRVLRRRLRALEESVERRDADRETIDKDVDAALQETESTVKELYAALQSAQLEAETLQKSLATKTLESRVIEQAKDAVLAAAETASQQHQAEVARLQEELAAARRARDKEVAAAQAKKDVKAELRVAAFSFDVPLTSPSSMRAAAAVLKDGQQLRLLHGLLLGYAGRTAGAAPVQVKKCVLKESTTTNARTSSSSSNSSSGGSSGGTASTTPALLQISVDLAFYAVKAEEEEAMQKELQRKLRDGGSCPVVQEFLRSHAEATRKDAAAAAEAHRAVAEAEQRATAAIAAMRAETQHAHETKLEAAASQLREINARVSSILPGPIEAVVARVDQLLTRLTVAEGAARQHTEAAARAERRLVEVQQEREQLQQTMSELTTRCSEMRLAKEQAVARLANAEAQLATVQGTAAESETALGEKVRRLDSALRAKTAAAESERAAAAAASARLADAQSALAERDESLARLKAQLAAAASAASPPSTSAGGAAKNASGEEAALREALRLAKEDRAQLARQVREMETDMNDLSNIQASMQRELEAAQKELRAKKHDFDLLVKQLIRMEEKEKKWQQEQQQQDSTQQQQQCPASPHTPLRSRADDAEDEKDDVAREALVVLANSNNSLQHCLRKLQRTMHTMGMDTKRSSGSSALSTPAPAPLSATASSHGEEERSSHHTANNTINNSSIASINGRRSGHRKAALAATVSRAATEHQQLSSQLSELLHPLLDELDGTFQRGSRGSGSGAATAFVRTASRHSNPASTSAAAAAGQPTRIVKQHLSSSPFMRTRSTPVVVQRISQGTHDDAAARGSGTPKQEEAQRAERVVFASPTVSGSGGKAVVDAAPRLDFHRQNSGRGFARSNTTAATAAAAAVPSATGSGSGGAGLPPTFGVATPNTKQSSAGAGVEGGSGERRSLEAAGSQRKPVVKASHAGRGGAAATTTAKTNPFRRCNTAAPVVAVAAAGSSSSASPAAAAAAATANAGGAASASGSGAGRVGGSASRRAPTNVTPESSGGATNVPKAYRMRF